MKRNARKRAPRHPQGGELNPYLVSAAESAPRQQAAHAGTGARTIFLASVVGPLVLVAIAAIAGFARFGRLERRLVEAGLLRFGWIAALLGVVLAVGAYRLTDNRRFETISDELRAVARLTTIGHAAAVIGTALAFELRYWTEFIVFEPASHYTRNVAEAVLALVAARHLALAGSGGAARAARWLAAAMLAAIAAEYLLTRTTRDDLYNPVPPQYAYMVLPITVALWVGKLAVFGTLAKRPPPRPALTPS